MRFGRRGLKRPPTEATTLPHNEIVTDTGRIERHIISLIAAQRVKNLAKTDISKAPQGGYGWKKAGFDEDRQAAREAIVRGGVGTATRTGGLLGGILTYAIEAGIIQSNPAHGLHKPNDNIRKR
jgi:hypothetical protein